MRTTDGRPADADDILYPTTIPFILLHLACFAAIWTGVTWQAAAIGMVLYWVRIFAIGAGYHRYFSHRAFSTSRAFQFVLAALAQSTAQKSVLWWAAKHRHHHLNSDTEHDVHSPRHKGFIYAHFGWIFVRQHDEADLTKVADLTRYPELLWLHKYELLPPVVLAMLTFAVGGLVWIGGRVLLEHGRGLSRHVLHQFPRARARLDPLRHRRRLPQQLAPGSLHHG
jgi:stearoyl-CoA desaturase (Delta-9 desaturase)